MNGDGWHASDWLWPGGADDAAGGWWLVAGGWWLVAGGWWLVAGGAQAEIYKWVDDNGVEHYSETPPPQKAGEVQATPLRHPSAVKVERPKQVPQAVRQTATSSSDDGYWRPLESEVLKLRRMFERGEFAQLSQLLEQRQQAVERDISAEFELWTAYRAFWHANGNEKDRNEKDSHLRLAK